MRVVLRDEAHPHCIAAKGTLHIPEGDDIGQYIGRLVPITITDEYSDVPLNVRNVGTISRESDSERYKFEVAEMERGLGYGSRAGVLRIVSEG